MSEKPTLSGGSDSRALVTDSTFRVTITEAPATHDRLGRPSAVPYSVRVSWDSVIMLDAWADDPAHAARLISAAIDGAVTRIARGLR